jgi:hypothetical protein
MILNRFFLLRTDLKSRIRLKLLQINKLGIIQ